MKASLLLPLLLLSLSLSSQNLVLNPSFEELRKKENKGFSNSKDFNDNLLHWTSPTRATPDYHNQNPELLPERLRQSAYNISIQKTMVPPRTGDKMAGIHTYGYVSTNYCDKTTNGEIREYLQGTLKAPLVPGETYFVRFWVNKTTRTIATSHLGIHFLTQPIDNDDCYRLSLQPQVVKEEVPKIENQEWIAISGTFIAQEAFQYFIIGNFESNEHTKIQKTSQRHTSCYYYIDDVYIAKALTKAEIMALKAQEKPKELSLGERIQTNETIVLDQVFFETNSSVLKTASFRQLEELAQWLNQHPDTRILIKGYTDNRGNEAYNQQLSEERAQSVAQALQQRGVSPGQVDIKGYGSQQALNGNTTDQERQLNRRVAFEILEKKE